MFICEWSDQLINMVSAKLRFVLVVVLLAAYTSPVHSQPIGHERKYFFCLLNFLLKSFKRIYLMSQSYASVALWWIFFFSFTSHFRHKTATAQFTNRTNCETWYLQKNHFIRRFKAEGLNVFHPVWVRFIIKIGWCCCL